MNILEHIVKCTTLICSVLFVTSCADNDVIKTYDELIDESSYSQKNDSFVSLSKAGATARMFMNKMSNNISTRAYNSLSDTKTIYKDGKPLMYVFNYSSGGFVIVSASKDYYPILAYSEESNFDTSLGINGITSWVEDTKELIWSSESLNDSIKIKIQHLWDVLDKQYYPSTRGKLSTRAGLSAAEIACYMRCEDYLNQYGYEGDEGWHFMPLADAEQVLKDIGYSTLYDGLCYSAEFNHSTPSTSVLGLKYCTEKEIVGPLISTTWHQNSPFSDYCNGHEAGCGAIAMAQVMNYHKYPSQFTLDENTYNWSNFSYAALVKYVYNIIGSEHVDLPFVGNRVYTTPGHMEEGIRKLGYNVSVGDDDPYRVEQVIMSGKNPVIMLGNDTRIPLLPSPLSYIGKSHYWICDGQNRMIQGRLYIFTEWQPNGNGSFVSGWGTINSPDVYGGVVSSYSHMNWGWGGKCNGWFISDTSINSAVGFDYPYMDNSGDDDYEHARKNFYISKKY